MGEPARILTIEDEQPVRSGIVAYLQESGFSVLEATDCLSVLYCYLPARASGRCSV
jgi:DNA-binding response OmpR family regulator